VKTLVALSRIVFRMTTAQRKIQDEAEATRPTLGFI